MQNTMLNTLIYITDNQLQINYNYKKEEAITIGVRMV